MLRVGLTGGIGAGKSTVAARLRELGAVVVDGDAIAREIVQPGCPALARIRERFGDSVIRDDGSLDRAALAAIVFPDAAALADLESITGPAIAAAADAQRAAAPRDVVTVYDMPLLVEKGLWVHEHLTVVVGADEQVRVRRLVGQRGLSEDDVRHRMARQATDAQRREAADVWVDNSGSREQTVAAVDALWRDRLSPYDANLRAGVPGTDPGSAVVVPVDPTWPEQAARLVARVADCLATQADAVVAIEHVGPTSTPGRDAPDVVDLALTVRSAAAAQPAGLWDALAERGFVAPEGQARSGGPLVSADPGRAATLTVQRVFDARVR